MRKIKFRFWNKEEKIMCYKNEDNSSSYWDGVDCSIVELINNELNSDFTKEDYEIMQYTGLKDKNGKEIYEGDIVKLHYIKNGLAEIKAEVAYSEEYAQYIIKNTKYATDDYEPLSDYEDLEVIGNIYENSDLLKN